MYALIISSRNKAGIGKIEGSKSPMVRLAIGSPFLINSLTSLASFIISEPIKCSAILDTFSFFCCWISRDINNLDRLQTYVNLKLGG